MANVINIGGGANGGGTSVVPNPQGTATDTLTKLGIEGTIYDFAGGGSGGSSYSETTLWSGSESSTASGAIITLSDNITNYDDIIFVAHANNSADVGFARFNVSLLTVGNTYLQDVYDPNLFTIFWGLDSLTQIKWYSVTQQRAIIVTEIVGIKYGGGSNSGHNYSTTEQVVGTWIDGSTVYEKTFEFSYASTETWSSATLGLNIDKVVYLFAYVKLGTQGGSQWITSPFIESSNYRCDCHYQSADDKFYVKSNWSSTNAIITIRYTKSTT